jgi:hypothetical protein
MKQTFYAEARERAYAQASVPIGTVGNIDVELRAGHEYVYWRHVDANGTAVREYLGSEGDAKAAKTIERRIAELSDWRALATAARELRALGFSYADPLAGTVMGAMFNAGLFSGGGMLIGSHAYAAILNGLGFREPINYLTEDIDIARVEKIKLAANTGATWHGVLSSSGLNFLPVPELRRGDPPTSYKVAGKALRVDLLAPSRRNVIDNVSVPELGTNATALPDLSYLLGGPQNDGIIIAKEKVIPARLPSPARFCVHKLVVAGLRPRAQTSKRIKDIRQSGAIACALFDSGSEEELAEAVSELTATMRKTAIASLEKLNDDFLHDEHPNCAFLLLDAFKRAP